MRRTSFTEDASLACKRVARQRPKLHVLDTAGCKRHFFEWIELQVEYLSRDKCVLCYQDAHATAATGVAAATYPLRVTISLRDLHSFFPVPDNNQVLVFKAT